MSDIANYNEYLINDVFDQLDGVSSKRMFGGYGLYIDGAIFGVILSSSELCFKVDDRNRQIYKDAGSKQWVYEGHKNKKPTEMPYWHVPESWMEDKDTLYEQALISAEISRKK